MSYFPFQTKKKPPNHFLSEYNPPNMHLHKINHPLNLLLHSRAFPQLLIRRGNGPRNQVHKEQGYRSQVAVVVLGLTRLEREILYFWYPFDLQRGLKTSLSIDTQVSSFSFLSSTFAYMFMLQMAPNENVVTDYSDNKKPSSLMSCHQNNVVMHPWHPSNNGNFFQKTCRIITHLGLSSLVFSARLGLLKGSIAAGDKPYAKLRRVFYGIQAVLATAQSPVAATGLSLVGGEETDELHL